MSNSRNGPLFNQWMGTYECKYGSDSDFFSPLVINIDNTITVGGVPVDYNFEQQTQILYLKQFTLTKGGRTLTSPQAELQFSFVKGQATFKGKIQADPSSGFLSYWGSREREESSIPEFYSHGKMSTAVYNGQLHVIGTAFYHDSSRGRVILHRSFPLDSLVPDAEDKTEPYIHAIKNGTLWSTEQYQGIYGPAKGDFDLRYLKAPNFPHWASSPRDESGAITRGDATCLVATTDGMWLFYTFSDGGNMSLQARKYVGKPHSNEGTWGEVIKLYEPAEVRKAGPLLENTGAVSAVLFGNSQILVTCCGTGDTGTGGTGGPTYGKMMCYLFDTGDTTNSGDGKGWAALSKKWFDLNTDAEFYLQTEKWPLENRTGAGVSIDSDWIVSAVPQGEKKTAELAYFLAISFSVTSSNSGQNQHTNFKWQTLIPLDTQESEDSLPVRLKTAPWASDKLTAFSDQTPRQSAYKRDPSGRLQSFMAYDTDHTFAPIYTATSPLPSKDNQWGSTYPTDKIDVYVSQTNTPPTNEFYLYPKGKHTVQTPAQIKGQDAAKRTMVEATEYPVLEFICYGWCGIQLHHYGAIRLTKDTQYAISKDREVPIYQVGGYFDGPIPFPKQNYKGVKNLTGDTEEIGTFRYGVETEKAATKATETGSKLTIESDGKTTEGLGPSYEVAFDYKTAQKDETENASEIKSYLPNQCGISNPAPYDEPEAEGVGNATLLAAELQMSGFQFANRWGELITDSLSSDKAQSAKLGSVLVRMQQPQLQSMSTFESELVTKGDLESYTAEKINAKMKAAGYDGDNYVKDIICKNAYVFENGQSFLEYTWSNKQLSGQEAGSMKKTFTEHSWSVGFEGKIGISGGGGIDFFGIGEEFEFNAMIGGGYEREWTEEDLTSVKWTVGVEENFALRMPLAVDKGGSPDGVTLYSFRAYFLPVPRSPSTLPTNQWTTDLQAILPEKKSGETNITKQNIDTGSGCWRIAFLVTKIDYREGSSKTDYAMPSELEHVKSVYEQS